MHKSFALEWSPRAVADRDAIFDFIESDSPRAAVETDSRIGQAISALQQFPRMGRAGRIRGTREFVVPGTLYIAAYKVTRRTVRILRVLHGAQSWPNQMPA